LAPQVTASLTHVLVQQHPDQQGERVAAEQLVGGGVLGDAKQRHLGSVPARAPVAIRGDHGDGLAPIEVTAAASPPDVDRTDR
jgi:hypothetical protein